MATIYRKGTGWRAQVCVKGVRDSTVKPTRQEAAQWALQREAELGGRRLPDKSLKDALAQYEADVTPTRRNPRWEEIKLACFRRDARLKEVKPATVARELTLLRAVLEHARKAPRRWILVNPMQDVHWPQVPDGRRRRVSPEEVTQVRLAFGIGRDYQGATQTQRVGLAFLFALETAMRSGEILGLDWRDVKLASRYVVLRGTKNGDVREVPLTLAACDILRALPSKEGPVFELTDALRDALWRKMRPASLKDLHFHDSRGEAIWRLSKKLDVLQLAQVIGHRDLKSLQHYYRATAAEMAMQLG